MARVIRFRRGKGAFIGADELREVYHRMQLARQISKDANARLRALCDRVRDGARVEECELTLDAGLELLMDLPVRRSRESVEQRE